MVMPGLVFFFFFPFSSLSPSLGFNRRSLAGFWGDLLAPK